MTKYIDFVLIQQ